MGNIISDEQVIINYILEEVEEHLLKHVSFKRELLSLLKFIYASVDKERPVIPFISKDRREVSFSNTETVKNQSNGVENKLVVRGNIIIGLDGSLTINKISGIVYNEEKGKYNSVLYTYYYQEYFNRFGVSLSKVTFTDEYLLEEFINQVPIKEYVFSTIHKPEFSFGNLIGLPQIYMNASITHIYRNYKNPGLIYVENTSNIRENRRLLSNKSKKIYLSDPDNPQDLNFILEPIAVYDELTRDYKKIEEF